MALSRVKVWIAGEVLLASDQNGEFNNILNNALALISPLTGTLDVDGQRLTLDSDGDLNFLTTSDDVLALRKDTTSLFVWDAATASVVNGLQFLSTIANDAVEIQAQGTDAQIHVRLVPKGAQATVSSSGGWAVEGTTEAEWRIDASAGDFLLQENTGSVASPTWTTRWTLAAGASVGTAVLVNTGTGTTNVPLVSDILGKQTIYIPADAMKYDSAGSPPTPATVRFANAPYVSGLRFDNVTEQEAFFDFSSPKSYDGGSMDVQGVYFHQGGQTVGLDGVALGIGLVARAEDESFAAAFEEVVVTKDDSSSSVPLFTSVGAVTPSTATANTEEIIFGRVRRIPSNGADDLDITIILIGVIIHYTTNALNDD